MKILGYPDNFGMIHQTQSSYKASEFVILPVPYEGTTSYGKGTRNGPDALIKASHQLEMYDEEMESHPCEKGICTLAHLNEKDHTKLMKDISETCRKISTDNKRVCMIGGEHSITFGAVVGIKKNHPHMTVLHIDAHADMKDEYDNSKFSHACIARRVSETTPLVLAGVRSCSEDEVQYVKRKRIPIFFAKDMFKDSKQHWMRESIDKLGEEVYISLDLDALDLNTMPATGTPEPGGFTWQEMLEYLKVVCHNRNVVGFDIVELAPKPGFDAYDYLAAKLVYKIISYISSKN